MWVTCESQEVEWWCCLIHLNFINILLRLNPCITQNLNALCLPSHQDTVLQMDIATKNRLFLPMRQNDRCPQKLSSFRCLRCSSFIAQVIILSDPRAGAIRAGSELTVLCCLVSWGLGCGTLDGPSWRIFVGAVFFKATIDCFQITAFASGTETSSKIRKESFSFTVKSVSSWPVIAITRSRSYCKLLHSGGYNHLSLDHRVSYSEQKVVLSSRLGNPSENDIKWIQVT